MLYCPAAVFTRRFGLLWCYHSVSVSEEQYKATELKKMEDVIRPVIALRKTYVQTSVWLGVAQNVFISYSTRADNFVPS